MRRQSLNTSCVGVLLALAVWQMALPAQAHIFDCPGCQYATILGVNESITGVRGYDGTAVVLTGSYVESGVPQGQWWLGSLKTASGTTYRVSPALSGQTVTSSIYYGPNTALFDPGLGSGNIRLVGSYQYKESPPAVKCPPADGGSPTAGACNHGVMYTGPLNGTGGTWMQLDVPSTCAGGATVANTIPHSTMGDLVVGNYDLLGAPGAFNAFIYNISTSSCTPFDLDPIFGTDDFITAYGIWQNGIGSSHYTIAGGARHEGINKAFLVDYHPSTGFSNLTYFGEDSLVGFTHFEGITGRDGGYNLVGTTDTGAVFASIDRRLDGTFGRATWVQIEYPDNAPPVGHTLLSTGNTVYENYAMGIYIKQNISGERSYVVLVSGPVQGQIRSGTAVQVGVAPAPDGSGRGSLKITGVFAFEGPINLGAAGAKARILAGLDEGGSGGELILGGELTLVADGRNTAKTARFKTAPGETPAAAVTIGSRGRGQFTLVLDMSRATIDVPGACPRPELATVIEVDDETNPPLRIAFEQPWQCLQRGGKVEYLRTP